MVVVIIIIQAVRIGNKINNEMRTTLTTIVALMIVYILHGDAAWEGPCPLGSFASTAVLGSLLRWQKSWLLTCKHHMAV